MIDVSVVITCYNRKDYLDYALASFAAQTFPKDRFEVIVVDDGSTDGTVDHIRCKSSPFRLKTVQIKDNMGVSYARNRGIDEAEGKIVIFSDSDIIVPPDYLKYHWKAHKKGDQLVVSAPFRYHIYTVIFPEQLDSKLWREMKSRSPELGKRISNGFPMDGRPLPVLTLDEIHSGFVNQVIPRKRGKSMSEFMNRYPDLSKCPMPWLAYAGSNSSVPRKSLLAIKGFDEEIRNRHDDRDIGYRLHLSGHKFVMEPRIIATHQDHLLKKDRSKMEYFSFHDLAIMLKKYPYLDLFLFGLYQTDKRRFKSTLLPELKRQINAIKKIDSRGKNDTELMENLLRRFVIQTIHSAVNSSPLRHLEEHSNYKTSFYVDWRKTLKRYRVFPLFTKVTKYLLKKVRNGG
ncbi:MAG: glycosyltransferase family 2 protein [Paenibacillaceae bacterium]